MNRTPVVTLAWCDFQARTVGLASALGGESHFISSRALRQRALLPVRYVRNAIASWQVLTQADPAAVIVITPPVFAPIVAWLWCLAHRCPLIVDCHTGAFHSRKWAWARPLHRLVLRRARLALLHTDQGAAEVASWGVRTLVLPDDMPDPSEAGLERQTERPVIVVAGSLDTNEPIGLVVEAARQLPDVELRCTGDQARLSAQVRGSAPVNVTFTGWLDYAHFLGELLAADVVAAFSTDPQIMNRAAFEAVGLGRPLVLSDLPLLRERFADAALFASNEPTAMAQALRTALNQAGALAERSRAFQHRLRRDREAALTVLRTAIETQPRPARSRRILVVSAHAYPTHPLLRRNVEHLASEGIELDVVCLRDEKVRQPRPPGRMRMFALPVKHRRTRALSYVREYAAFFAMAFPLVTLLSLRRRYEVVQVDNLPDFLVFTALLPRLRGSRIVLYIYDLFPEMTMTRLRAGSEHPLVRVAQRLERWSAAFADHVITVSQHFRSILAGRGVDPSRVSILYNSQPMPDGILHQPPARPVLITHASLLERYGVQVAIRALPYLVGDWPQLRLQVLGEGEYRPQLESLATELRVANRVEFAGFLPWREAMERISRASIGIVPVIADGFGELILPGKLLEYTAIGIPVVCSRLPGIEEAFPADVLGYFPQGDANSLASQVDRLLRDPVAARAQAERARQSLRRISWDTVAPQYLATLVPA